MTTYYMIFMEGTRELGLSFGASDFNEASRIAAAFAAGYRTGNSGVKVSISSLTTRRTRGVTYEALL